MNILNLPGWEVTGHTRTKTDYRIEAVYTPEPTACPECSTLFDRLYRHGKREQEIRDLPAHGKRVVIALTRKRYRCQGCGRTFLQPLPDVDDRAQMTRRLAEWELGIKGTQMTAAYKPLLTAMYNWHDHIFAYWDHRVTNAVTEALNGVAKLMERNGRGYSFDVIRAKLLYYYRHLDRVPKPVSSGRRTNNFAGSPVEPPDGVTALRLGVDIDRLLETLEAEERGRTTSNLPAGKGRPKK